MASFKSSSSSLTAFKFHLGLFLLLAGCASAQLSTNFYGTSCPNVLSVIKSAVGSAVSNEARMGASLLRLHFHDCFVNGCDASVLLDGGENTAPANTNSLRGFDVIDNIKTQLESSCPGVVSCADILSVAARDSVVALGGPTWPVLLGRKDSTTASRDQANKDLPPPFLDLPALISNFKRQGLNERDLVALSGGHTIGPAQCFTFRDRIYNKTNIDHKFADQLKSSCPLKGGDSNLAPLDPTPVQFDVAYFDSLVKKRGLLPSDQALFNGGSTDGLVKAYSSNAKAFGADFARSMVKMGNIKILTGEQGQVRLNCRKPN
ncbi:hypothetical protein OIU78_001584 [Salix suchowensis]|nr:hypothetical protein OIU78_001584 [Salix suchowensis]